MSLIATVGCLLNYHSPSRRDVTWDGGQYVGQCRHCGAPIARHKRRIWRRRKEADQAERTSG